MLNRRELLATLPAPLFAQNRQPNILFIISDDHHWQCLGAAGNPHIQTPNLDKLAERGVMFTNAIISTSQCAPSRGILLSGQEIYQTGLDCNDHTGFRSFQGATVVEQLRERGYETTLVGKWHIAPSPSECGFTKAPVWLQPAATRYVNASLRHGLDAKEDQETPGHVTEIFSREAVKAIQAARQPYLLWLSYNAPHTPWTAGEKYRKLYAGNNARIAPPAHPKPRANTTAPPAPQRGPGVGVGPGARGVANAGARAGLGGGPGAGGFGRGGVRPDGSFDWETYYAVLSETDAGIGQVLAAVESAGQWENTLIVFIGDNGYLCGSKGFQGKVRAWEESIRIPFLVAGGRIRQAARSDAAVASIDVPATMLDYAGVRPSHKLSGLSLRSALTGGTFPREDAFSVWNDGRPEALVARQAIEPYRVSRTPSHKYIVWESKQEALYDLTADPFEEKNLASDPAYAAVLKRRKDSLRARMKETADPAIAWL